MDTSSNFELKGDGGLWRGRFVAMANPCEVLCETPERARAHEIVAAAAEEALRIERKFSRYRSDNIVHAINTARGCAVEVDEETARLIDYGARLHALSDGAFDLTSGVLRKVWRFGADAELPAAVEVQTLLADIGWQRTVWRSPRLSLPAGMQIDFGGIGKEYAVDRVVEALDGTGAVPVLVNFGGDLRCAGPAPRGGAWQVGIESTVRAGQAVRLIRLSAGALATSGDTRRCIEANGRRYGHILDARSGWPAPGAPHSVTVAADTCSLAGTFATLAMLKGAQAEEFLREEGVQFWCYR